MCRNVHRVPLLLEVLREVTPLPGIHRRNLGLWSFPFGLELVEMGLRIGLGPEAHFAGMLERSVRDLPQLPAVQVTFHLVAFGLDLELMPFTRRDLHALLAANLAAFPGHNMVNPIIVLQGIHAADVVVVVVLVAPNEASALIAFARDRFERNAQFDILVVGVLGHTDVEDAAGALGNLGQRQAALGGSRLILHQLPYAPFALSGLLGLSTGGHSTDILLREFECAFLPLIGPKRCACQCDKRHCSCPSHRSVSLKQRDSRNRHRASYHPLSASLVQQAQKLAPALIPELEVVRARTQARRSLQIVQSTQERWRVTSADLARILRLDSSAVLEPLEPPHLQVTLVALDQPIAELIQIGLTNRPELASQQALVQQMLARIRQEKLRPFVPSILVRGASTTDTGTLAGGVFGGGPNDNLSNFAARFDVDVQVLWELKELGFGNRALVRQREAENEVAVLEQFRTQDRIAAEVARAYAQAKSAANRLSDTEAELKDAVESADKNVEGLTQTHRLANVLIPIVRPQEVVAAFQALAQAYADYYGAVADYDRAQFRLYHALGHPAQALAQERIGSEAVPPLPTDSPTGR
jgi:hypothetical protein